MRIGFVFPGQGSQRVGMGQDILEAFPESGQWFDRASACLGRDLKTICLQGPNDVLTQTNNAQPAIFVMSVILLELLKKKNIRPSMVAGHSLGEITAYYAAGVLDFESALRVIKVRGEGMATAFPSDRSAMAAVMGMDADDMARVVAPFADRPVVLANFNCPGQIVISGEKQGVADAIVALKAAGGKVIPLNVSGAFHSPLMQKGADQLAAFVNSVSFQSADVPVVLNRNAQPEQQADRLKENLPLQVVSSVQWIDSVRRLAQDVDCFVECGPGKVLTGLIKKIAVTPPVYSVNDVESLGVFETHCATV